MNDQHSPRLRFRLLLGRSVAIGPGKADLLAAVAATGSISAAGRSMGMSYKLLAVVGVLLIVEAFLTSSQALVPRESVWLIISGLALGLLIGAVAALLGVAGGELLIPTLLFIYGADIKTAGTASLMISIVTVGSGLWRYRRLDVLPDRTAMRQVALPMGIGSIIGAVIGGLSVGILSVLLLKVVLGVVLIAAASKGLWSGKRTPL